MTNQTLQFMNQILPNLPEAVEYEKLVLGVLMDDPDATNAILTLERDDFYLEQHKRILDARLAAHLKSPDSAITLDEFRHRLARRL